MCFVMNRKPCRQVMVYPTLLGRRRVWRMERANLDSQLFILVSGGHDELS